MQLQIHTRNKHFADHPSSQQQGMCFCTQRKIHLPFHIRTIARSFFFFFLFLNCIAWHSLKEQLYIEDDTAVKLTYCTMTIFWFQYLRTITIARLQSGRTLELDVSYIHIYVQRRIQVNPKKCWAACSNSINLDVRLVKLVALTRLARSSAHKTWTIKGQ